MPKKSLIAFPIAILIIINFSGCTLLNSTEFQLISTSIYDDEGFPSLLIRFNVTDSITVKMTDPSKKLIFSEKILSSEHQVIVHLAEFRSTPIPGKYNLKIVDNNNNIIFENELIFAGQNLAITKIKEDWWQDKLKLSLVGLEMTVRNNGDLPVYPHKVEIDLNGKNTFGYILPDVIMPYQTKDICSYVYVGDSPLESIDMNTIVKDKDDAIIASYVKQVTPSANVQDLKFDWKHNEYYTLIIPDIKFLYDHYVSLDRLILDDYAAYVFDIYDDFYVDLVSQKLRSLTDETSDFEVVNFIGSFVQKLDYAEDDPNDPTCEYPRYPVEMLKDTQGDCEDKAMLCASILKSLGYNVSLIRLPKHMAVGINLPEDSSVYDYFADSYYYLETTRYPSPLGRVPDDYKGITNFTIYPLYDRPLLIHNWINSTRYFSTDKSSDYVKMKIMIQNLGTKTAYDFYVTAAFYDQQGNELNVETKLISSLEYSDKTVVEMQIDVPQGLSTKLKTRIYYDNEMVHEKESTNIFN